MVSVSWGNLQSAQCKKLIQWGTVSFVCSLLINMCSNTDGLVQWRVFARDICCWTPWLNGCALSWSWSRMYNTKPMSWSSSRATPDQPFLWSNRGRWGSFLHIEKSRPKRIIGEVIKPFKPFKAFLGYWKRWKRWKVVVEHGCRSADVYSLGPGNAIVGAL